MADDEPPALHPEPTMNAALNTVPASLDSIIDVFEARAAASLLAHDEAVYADTVKRAEEYVADDAATRAAHRKEEARADKALARTLARSRR